MAPAAFSALRVSCGINLAGEELSGVVALLAGAVYPQTGLLVLAPGERHVVINSEAQQLLFAAESILQAPPFTACRVTSRNSPPLSKSFRGFASALAFLMAMSISGMWGNHPRVVLVTPISIPCYPRLSTVGRGSGWTSICRFSAEIPLFSEALGCLRKG